jgi:ABC-type phosphate transport system auxiliary subunit|tara:strand:+ start:898 stop:1023 length:126 start_codon:yes stop_codon:yes gene_type:complete
MVVFTFMNGGSVDIRMLVAYGILLILAGLFFSYFNWILGSI